MPPVSNPLPALTASQGQRKIESENWLSWKTLRCESRLTPIPRSLSVKVLPCTRLSLAPSKYSALPVVAEGQVRKDDETLPDGERVVEARDHHRESVRVRVLCEPDIKLGAAGVEAREVPGEDLQVAECRVGVEPLAVHGHQVPV